MLEQKDICETTTVENDEIKTLTKQYDKGLVVIADEKYSELEKPTVKSCTGDFAKWINKNHSDIKVTLPKNSAKEDLRCGDLWLPLVYLATDITLPIYLNLVSSYIYEKMKGALKGDVARVHLSVMYEDTQKGTLKRFDFEGDAEALKNTIKKMDINKFLDE